MILFKKMKYFLKKISGIFLAISISILFTITNAKAEIYDEIIVKGNDRLSVETIIMFSGLKIKSDINDDKLNISLKNLYKTNYFRDVKIYSEKKTLIIDVDENPIIQSIKIEGIKNKTILKQLLNITKKNEKYPFLKNKVIEQKNLLLNIVRTTGYYFADIETNVIDNKNNSVDIIYDFNLGKRAIIKKINFQGNKIFRDSKLRNVIKSEEGRFWKFITSDKYLDEAKIKNDEKFLKNYYKNKGYFNVIIKSSYAKNINNEFFELNFNIDAGPKYYFNDIEIKINEDFDEANFLNIKKEILNLKGEKFSPKKLDKIQDKINKIVLLKEFVFLDAKYNLVIVEKNKIDVKFKFESLEKFYVDQINI